MTGSLPLAAQCATGMTKAADAPACGAMRTSFFGYEKSKSALPRMRFAFRGGGKATFISGGSPPPRVAEALA